METTDTNKTISSDIQTFEQRLDKLLVLLQRLLSGSCPDKFLVEDKQLWQ